VVDSRIAIRSDRTFVLIRACRRGRYRLRPDRSDSPVASGRSAGGVSRVAEWNMGNQAFYATAAQVIPIFFLVAAVERRIVPMQPFVNEREFLFALIVIPVVLLSMFGGEVTAIIALSTDSTSFLLLATTLYSLGLGGAFVVIRAALGSFDALEERIKDDRPEWIPHVERARELTRQAMGPIIVGAAFVYLLAVW
jgi:hypothetical protein